jgi:hypothetical protein
LSHGKTCSLNVNRSAPLDELGVLSLSNH